MVAASFDDQTSITIMRHFRYKRADVSQNRHQIGIIHSMNKTKQIFRDSAKPTLTAP
jgi:hypothetical protein